MLLNLHVKNLALIDEIEVNFKSGLNILTGETGAGKSIIIGSVNLALGAKADKDIIRSGAEYALIELVFQLTTSEQLHKMKELELPIEEDGTLILQRKIMPTRSVCKVCGETVTVGQLKELAPILLDIYGQHDYQSLLQTKKHREILDGFAGENASILKSKIKNEYEKYNALKKTIEAPEGDSKLRNKELSLATFELDEIRNAQLIQGEDEEKQARFHQMENFEKITQAMGKSLYLLKEDDESCENSINRALKEMNTIASCDEKASELIDRIATIGDLVHDVSKDMEYYLQGLEFDPQEFNSISLRLDLINHLKSKYGNSIAQIEEYANSREAMIEKLSDYENYLNNAKKQLLEEENVIRSLCEELTIERKKVAKALQKEISDALFDLNFTQAQFVIEITPEDHFSAQGKDFVEFKISTNQGEDVKSLGSVASGGELSRIMLAIKTVSAQRDAINTLIFDEIDSGISGKTAWKVSEKLGFLGKSHQIICITHLPQIAAMADAHFCISKSVDAGKTYTNIEELSQEGTIGELARLLGGDVVTDTVISNAKELRKLAKKG